MATIAPMDFRICGFPIQSDAQPELTLSWEQPVTLNTLQITFAIDTTLRIYRDVHTPVMPLIGQDFVVQARVDGQERLWLSFRIILRKYAEYRLIRLPPIEYLSDSTAAIQGKWGI